MPSTENAAVESHTLTAPAPVGATHATIFRVSFAWDLDDGEPDEDAAARLEERPPCKMASVRTFAKKEPIIECALDVPCPPWATLDTLDKAGARFESDLKDIVGKVSRRRMKGL